MTTDIQTRPLTPIDKLKAVINADSVKEQFINAMGENAQLFTASLIDIYTTDKGLQECEPSLVVMEALKAATLKLPINKSLGQAWIVAYKGKPQFQMGYKGYIQLAMRSGQYKYLNADKVYEGELVSEDKLTGSIDLSGKKISDKIIGYFAHLETNNGFSKTAYSSVERVTSHAKKYSKGFANKKMPWQTDFDSMAIKTMLLALLPKYGIMTIEMATALGTAMAADNEQNFQNEANEGEIIDIEPITPPEPAPAPGPSF